MLLIISAVIPAIPTLQEVNCFSVAQSCPTLCNPMDCIMPGLLVLHHLLEFALTHVHWVGDAIQPSHPLLPSFLFAFDLSQHQCLFQSVGSFTSGGQSTRASVSASVLPMNIQCWFPLGMTNFNSLQFNGLSRVFSSNTVWKHQFFSTQPSLWSNSHIRTWLLEKPWPWQNISECFKKHLGIFR